MLAGARGRFALAVTIAGLLTSAAALADPGDRDPAFDGDGVVLVQLGQGTEYRHVAAHPLGGYVATGRTSYTTAGQLSPLIITRHAAGGALDPGFGNGGIVRANFGDTVIEGFRVAVDSLNRIVVAARNLGGDVVVIRLTPTGALDTTFSGDGLSAPVDLDEQTTPVGIGILPDDRVLVAATHRVKEDPNGDWQTTFFQYLANGAPDTSFDGDGRASLTTGQQAFDMLSDSAGRAVYVRQDAKPEDLSVERLTMSGAIDTAFGSVTLPGAMRALDLRMAHHGGGILVAGASETDGISTFRVARLDIGAPSTLDSSFGSGGQATAVVPGTTVTTLRGLAALPDASFVASARTNPSRGLERVGLVRFTKTGQADTSFHPSNAPPFVSIDGLGLNGETDVDPLGGIVATADGKVVVAGYTNGAGNDDHAFLARYGALGQAPTAALSHAYRAIGNPATVRDYARPHQPIDFDASGSADPDGENLSYEWSLDGGPFQPGGPAHSAAFAQPGRHDVAVRIRDESGLDDVAQTSVFVRENIAPTAAMFADQNTWTPSTLRNPMLAGRPVIFRSAASDVDGNIKKVEWDVDQQSGFEAVAQATYRTYLETGQVTVGVRVTDDEGLVSFRQEVLTITQPPCEDSRRIEIGRLVATADCWNKVVSEGGAKTVWTASESPPEPMSPPPGLDVHGPPVMSPAQQHQIDFAGRVYINGLVFTDYDVLQITKRSGKKTQLSFTGARIETTSRDATRVVLTEDAGDTWRLDGNKLESVALSRASYAGLDVGTLVDSEVPLPRKGAASLRFYPLLPAGLGGVTSDDLVTVETGARAGTATSRAQAAQQGGLDCFSASGATLPGLSLLAGNQGVRVCRDPDRADRWVIYVTVDLASFTGGAFPGLPAVKATAEIVGGVLSVSAIANWNPDQGYPLIGPVFLTQLGFQLVQGGSQAITASCVPKRGTEYISNQGLRDALVSRGVSRTVVNANIPDAILDHGVPSSAMCGNVRFRVGMPEITLARGNLALGVAKYDDDRPDAFRIIGTAEILDVVDADVMLAIYSNGYADMRASVRAEFYSLVSLDGGLRFEVDAPSRRFNAEAWIKGCVIPLDFCSSIKALVSTKGMGACLGLYFLGGRWEPGATYRYGDGLTLYFDGCDLGDVREYLSGNGSTQVELVPPPATAAAAKVGWKEPPGRAPLAQASVSELSFDVAAGLPGTYVAVRGKNNQLAKFSLRGPRGERISADGATSEDDPTLAENLIVGHDQRTGVTHVLIGAPSPGRWTIVPESGSVPIVEVVGAEGIDKPGIAGRVTGKRHNRKLRYEIEPQKGQVVHFSERGPSGRQQLGRARPGKHVLRFAPAPGRAERREIVAVVEQDGLLREEVVVTRYKAPSTRKPSRVGRLKVRRAGSRVKVAWRPAAGAKRYLVRVKLSDGRVVKRELEARRLTLSKVTRRTSGKIHVAAVNEVGTAGRATARTLRRKR